MRASAIVTGKPHRDQGGARGKVEENRPRAEWRAEDALERAERDGEREDEGADVVSEAGLRETRDDDVAACVANHVGGEVRSRRKGRACGVATTLSR